MNFFKISNVSTGEQTSYKVLLKKKGGPKLNFLSEEILDAVGVPPKEYPGVLIRISSKETGCRSG